MIIQWTSRAEHVVSDCNVGAAASVSLLVFDGVFGNDVQGAATDQKSVH